MESDALSSTQYSSFKDCLARRIISRPGMLESGEDASDLHDFTSYLASEVWSSIPEAVQEATYSTRGSVPSIDTLSFYNAPTSFIDTLTSSGIAEDSDDALAFLRRIVEDYYAEVCAPPPMWSKTRTKECEICEREIPLTYHHLIPREVHNKVLKKKWHPEHMLNSVAWLCR